ncbi:MAG: BlaI/MecI/CopY family transcriptional regulator [Planctomycetaceae bacterium]
MAAQRPTDTELKLLRVLWERGPSTVREVFESLPENDSGYTTVLKLMQIMFEKGLVTRDESNRSHVYKAKQKAEQTQRSLVKDLATRAFGGATNKLVMQALRSKKVTTEELAEIRELLDELEGK